MLLHLRINVKRITPSLPDWQTAAPLPFFLFT
jgi:hypothetical protein